jgi:glycosyltransferase involved in cell wall biosynthesis
VKVLMLGWELPPRISGGLGTACAGIVRGLVAHGVEVLFVVPHMDGDERLPGAQVVGADRVPLDDCAPRAPQSPSQMVRRSEIRSRAVSSEHVRPESPSAAERLATESFEERTLPPDVRVHSIASPLRPYMSASRYVEVLERAGLRRPNPQPALARTAERSAPAPTSAACETWIAQWTESASEEGALTPQAARYVALHGGYGPDLFAEVARYAEAVAALAARERFDVIHAHDWMTFPAGVAAAQRSGRPLVLHVHASEFDRSGERADTRIRAIEGESLAAAARVVCVSRYTAELVRRHYGIAPERLRTVHNAVEQPVIARPRAERSRERLVLFLGRVTFQKGPEYFLEAAARVLRVEPDVRFVLCGAGDLLPRVVERAAELGIARRVRFTGFLEREAVERVFGMADVYVMPSVSEPFGIAPLEALSRDVPVIVSRQSGVAEVLKSALKVDYWDVAEMANKILALLRYPALRRALEDEGRAELGGLRWEDRGQRLRDIYAELVA